MKNKFSISWKASTKPRKQRKYRYNAPLHVKQKFVHSHLSKELREKYNRRSLRVRKGDKVKLLRGQHKKHVGKVDTVDIKKTRIIIEGIEVTKKDGSKTTYHTHPSNVVIIELNLDDKMRQKILKRKTK